MAIPELTPPPRLDVIALDEPARALLDRWAPELLAGLGWTHCRGAVPTVDLRLWGEPGAASSGAAALCVQAEDGPPAPAIRASVVDRGSFVALLASPVADTAWWTGASERGDLGGALPAAVWPLLARWVCARGEAPPWLSLAHGGWRSPALVAFAAELRADCARTGMFTWREAPPADADGVLVLAGSPGLSASPALVHARRVGTPLVLAGGGEAGLHMAAPEGCLQVP